jgi:hypothetical protein
MLRMRIFVHCCVRVLLCVLGFGVLVERIVGGYWGIVLKGITGMMVDKGLVKDNYGLYVYNTYNIHNHILGIMFIKNEYAYKAYSERHFTIGALTYDAFFVGFVDFMGFKVYMSLMCSIIRGV